MPAEVGYGTDAYPRHVKAGGWYNSAPYADPFLNTRGRSRGQLAGSRCSMRADGAACMRWATKWFAGVTGNALLRKARSPTLVSRHQFVFEANYNFRLVEGVFLASGLQ